ncbi:hypothetical protein [Halotia branconii]|uniref:Uncharacterized protein n=1 Tax=Halotia branconii CENA392 TaxID=1539056 RepID=A0AAJ6NUU4_9CYAN|nr:hypothetical protein [Halotia branconii]WGV27145.1 hypothetical protein QI031_06530 [Halotia branconii CENA392]
MTTYKSLDQNNTHFPEYSEENLAWLPSTFAEVVVMVKTFVLKEFDREVIQNQLYYHTREHLQDVQRRAIAIFQVIYPDWRESLDYTRLYLLLDLCAVAHDMIQIFVSQTQLHTSRRREAGVSETLTIKKVLSYIEELNQQLKKYCVNDSVLFTDADISIIQDAIQATICIYDSFEQSIYQPALYNPHKKLSVVAYIIAIADIGSLGMDGIAAYNQEGSLLFLEENPDIVTVILNQITATLAVDNPQLYENIRQRLLKRARFQVNFAKSRFIRHYQEIANLPKEAIITLTGQTFRYLNMQTIKEIESTTPTSEDTTLEELIDFFQLKSLISNKN